MTNYNQPHKFEDSGKLHFNGHRECVCGYSEVWKNVHLPTSTRQNMFERGEMASSDGPGDVAKPMTTIEEIVEKTIDSFAREYKYMLSVGDDSLAEKCKVKVVTALNKTLKDYGDAVRAEERELKFGTWEWLESQAGYQKIQELLNSDETTKETTKVALRDLIANYQKEEESLKKGIK